MPQQHRLTPQAHEHLLREQARRRWPVGAAILGIGLAWALAFASNLAVVCWLAMSVVETLRLLARMGTHPWILAGESLSRRAALGFALLLSILLVLCALALFCPRPGSWSVAAILLLLVGFIAHLFATSDNDSLVCSVVATPAACITIWLLVGRGGDTVPAAAMCGALLIVGLALVSQRRQASAAFARAADEVQSLETSLQNARRQADEALAAKARFFAAASHDLRQPLHALAVNATTLQLVAQRAGHAVMQSLSVNISHSLAHSDQLLDSLMEVSRLDSRSVSSQLCAVDLELLCRSLQGEFSAVAEQRAVHFDVRLERSLFAQSDEEMLTRILRNLLTNAFKFCGNPGHVELETRAVNDEAIVLVKDDGAGVPLEMQERVFEEFFQVGNPARDRSKGLGLGLAIVKRLCNLIGARVQLDSTPHSKTCFSIRLPRCDTSELEGPKPGLAAPRSLEVSLDGVRVLIVDDEPDVLAASEQLFVQVGALVGVATTYEQALQKVARGFRPDIAIVDYRLANRTGLELVRELRQVIVGLPVIVVSGDLETLHGQQPSDGGEVWLPKPLGGHSLLEAVASGIQRRQ